MGCTSQLPPIQPDRSSLVGYSRAIRVTWTYHGHVALTPARTKLSSGKNNRSICLRPDCQHKHLIIKRIGRLLSAYLVQSVHATLKFTILDTLHPRGHHDWPDKPTNRQLGSKSATPSERVLWPTERQTPRSVPHECRAGVVQVNDSPAVPGLVVDLLLSAVCVRPSLPPTMCMTVRKQEPHEIQLQFPRLVCGEGDDGESRTFRPQVSRP